MSKWNIGRFVIQFSANYGITQKNYFIRVFQHGRQKWFRINEGAPKLLDDDAIHDLKGADIQRSFNKDERPEFHGTKILVKTNCGIHDFTFSCENWQEWQKLLKKFPGIETDLKTDGD